jgi:hypothetical protein
MSTAGADAVTGNTGGVQKTDLSTTEVVFNVTKWAGGYIKINAAGARVLYVFSATAANTVLSDTEALDGASPNAGAPDILEDGGSEHEIVPIPAVGGSMYLHVKTVSGTARFKARKSQR